MPRDIMKQLHAGKAVNIKNDQIAGCGLDLQSLPSQTQHKIARAFHAGKGVRIQPKDVLGEGFVKNGAGFVGKGIFGKKFDKGLKKAGIKKAVFAASKAALPYAQDALLKGSAAFGPAAQAAALVAGDYLEKPTKYQNMMAGKGLAMQKPEYRAISTNQSTMLYPSHPAIQHPVLPFRGFGAKNF